MLGVLELGGGLTERLSQDQFMLISQWDRASMPSLILWRGRPESPAGAQPLHCLYSKEGLQFTDYNLPNPISRKEMTFKNCVLVVMKGLNKDLWVMSGRSFVHTRSQFFHPQMEERLTGIISEPPAGSEWMHPFWIDEARRGLSTACFIEWPPLCVPAALSVAVLQICVSLALCDTSEVGITLFPSYRHRQVH